jgi:very-short-patch-repair endonuclease
LLDSRALLTDYQRDYEIRDEDGRLGTVPEFCWPDLKIAVYCDGYAYHGDYDTLALDAQIRTAIQVLGWRVLEFWGKTIRQNADKCAQQVQQLLESQRNIKSHSRRKTKPRDV